MNKKVIAVGNKFMMDDGIALFVLDNIKTTLESGGIEVILGETDADFCFSKLNMEDEFYIVDSCLLGNAPGTVIFKTLREIKKQKTKHGLSHSLGVIDLMNIYNLDAKGYFIGIEIGDIHIRMGLSNILQKQFQVICNKILNFIIKNKK